jgi:arylformamidase
MARIIDISPVLSDRIQVWPGEVAFFCDVNTLTTSLHVGAHADAPAHLAPGGKTIDNVPLDVYCGPCQVMAAGVGRRGRVRPDHLFGEIRAPRVLFRTGTFPDPEVFSEDFAGLSPELAEWLSRKGVRLVGIDTPSVDPFEDRELTTHRALGRHGIACLEGLRLDAAVPGLYTLVALPLRIAGADGSPVRAALFPAGPLPD